MRGMRKGRDKDNNDYRNHFGRIVPTNVTRIVTP